MAGVSGDASEVYKLAADLSRVGARVVPVGRVVMAEIGKVFVKKWAETARETAGQHGVHYPDSIDSELAFGVTGISVDVGPNPAKPQGGMSFEFGSRNQPPHLDGLRALDSIQGEAEQTLDSAVGHLFG